ncbi:MAG: hypothetical protein AAGB34_03965 [Planctomycetota bacterium]
MKRSTTPLFASAIPLLLGACTQQGIMLSTDGIPSNSPPVTPSIAYPNVMSRNSVTRHYIAEDGARFEEIIEPTTDPDTLAKITRLENDEVVLVRTIVGTADGGIGVSEVLEADRGLITRFAPPLVLMPGNLGQEPFMQRVNVTVSPEDDPSAVERKGTGQLVMRLADPEAATDQANRQATHSVASTMALSFPPASVKRHSGRFFDTSGLVEEVWDERITVFGITSDEEQRRLILHKDTPRDSE